MASICGRHKVVTIEQAEREINTIRHYLCYLKTGGSGGTDSPDRVNGTATANVLADMAGFDFQINNGGLVDIVASTGSAAFSSTGNGLLFLSSAGNYFEDDHATPRGLQYDSDYSANYSPLSLVSKSFILFPSFGNGAATGDVTADISSHFLNILGSSGGMAVLIDNGTSTGTFTVSGTTDTTQIGWLVDDNSDGSLLTFGTDIVATFISTGTLKYGADYSANYSARSVIDKGYADGHYWKMTGTIATLTGNSTVAMAGHNLVISDSSVSRLEVDSGARVVIRQYDDGGSDRAARFLANNGTTYVDIGYGTINFNGGGTISTNSGGITLTPTGSKLTISTGVSNFANNAAAITGGLSAGDVYRNGDVLQIVH